MCYTNSVLDLFCTTFRLIGRTFILKWDASSYANQLQDLSLFEHEELMENKLHDSSRLFLNVMDEHSANYK